MDRALYEVHRGEWHWVQGTLDQTTDDASLVGWHQLCADWSDDHRCTHYNLGRNCFGSFNSLLGA